jgi:hypothetical protein
MRNEPALDPNNLNDYGKQLYWMSVAYRDTCGYIMRSLHRGDGIHQQEDEVLDRVVLHVRKLAEDAENTLIQLYP